MLAAAGVHFTVAAGRCRRAGDPRAHARSRCERRARRRSRRCWRAAKAEDVSGKHRRLARHRRRPGAGARRRVAEQAAELDAARAALRKLRGRTHELHSAVALAENGQGDVGARRDGAPDDARFLRRVPRRLSARAGDRVGQSVGAYEIEGLGVQLFDKHRRRLLHHPRPAAAAGARRAARARDHRDMKRACVIGWPIEHSRSPLIHGYWLKQYGIDGTYTKEAVRPEEVADFLRSLAAAGLRRLQRDGAAQGGGVRAAPTSATPPRVPCSGQYAVDRRRKAARRQHRHLRLHDATSTTRFRTGKPMTAPVCVLGAGGAARAIVYGFLEAGVDEVRVFNRTRARAEQLAEAVRAARQGLRLGQSQRRRRAKPACWSTRRPLGLKGGGSLGIDFAGFNEDCVVSDIVYVPLETRAAGAGARRAGCALSTGWACCCIRLCPASRSGSACVHR